MTSNGFLAALVALVAAVSAGWTGTRALATEKDAPSIYLESESHVFEPVFEGEPLSHSFEVVNRGRADLHILRVSPS